MRKTHRPLGAALMLCGAIAAIVLFVLPSTALSGSGKDAVSFYTNGKGNVIQKTGEDELLNIVGKNLNFTAAPDGVFCWAGKFADDGTPYTGWDIVTDWSYSTSKMLTDVDLDPDCGGANPGPGMKSAIMVEFDHGVIGDPTDDTFVVGPSIYVKPGT
jgi:hypothetical protein